MPNQVIVVQENVPADVVELLIPGLRGPKGDTGTTDYNELENLPILGTAASFDVALEGDANNDEIVLGSDSRLSDARAPTTHDHDSSYDALGAAADALTTVLDTVANSSGSSLVGHIANAAGAVATTVQAKLREGMISIKDFGAVGDGVADDTATVQAAINAAGRVHFPAGVYKITSEISIGSGAHLFGDGQGLTTLKFVKAANPLSSEFMMAMRRQTNVFVEHMTITSNAYDDGLFDLGAYDAGTKVYAGSDLGNINGVLISSCADVTFSNVEVSKFSYHGIRVSVEGGAAGDYNTNLTFDTIHGHHCRVTPLDILGTKGFKVVNSTFTDNGLFTGTYVDGGTGYGVVLGRTPAETQLRSFGGVCTHNFCARNARHGIDVHAGANILIAENTIEDALIMGIGVQDIAGSADDSLVGDIEVSANVIYHTPWVESRYPLIAYGTGPWERNDSIPIFVSRVGGSLLQNATVVNNQIRSWRFRQLTANASDDLVGAVAVSVVGHAKVLGNSVEQANLSYLPSFGLQLESRTFECSNNRWQCKQRSTVSKPFWSFNSANEGIISGNHFELQNIYTDAGATQAAYPMFEKVSGSFTFTGNALVQTSQGIRGPIWKSSYTNNFYGFNGVLAANWGNTLLLGGATRIEYASRINGALSIYISSTGGGRYDGLSSGNPFLVNSGTALLNILNDMPRCAGGLIINVLDNVAFGADGGVSVPAWQDNLYFVGNAADSTNAMTKTGGLTTTASSGLLTCPERSKNINFSYLYLKAPGSIVVYRPCTVKACAVECVSGGGTGLYFEYRQGYVSNTRFKGGTVGLGAYLGSTVVSQNNDSDASPPAYGLNANSAAIYKNGTQPTGSTAATLVQNGGTIA